MPKNLISFAVPLLTVCPLEKLAKINTSQKFLLKQYVFYLYSMYMVCVSADTKIIFFMFKHWGGAAAGSGIQGQEVQNEASHQKKKGVSALVMIMNGALPIPPIFNTKTLEFNTKAATVIKIVS